MLLGTLFGRAGITCPKYAENIEIRNIVTDSRQVTEGSLFICIKGLRQDGHEYITQALGKGAAVIVAESVREMCVGGAAAIILQDNTRKVAALLYNAYYDDPTSKLKVIGITGTNGKSSTARLLYDIFTEAKRPTGFIGTVCRLTTDGRDLSPKSADNREHMTTPDPEKLYKMLSDMQNDGAEYVIMEVSSHALALHKVDGIKFDLALFTNLTRDHLDFHGTMEEYYNAKRRLFTLSRRAIINIDGEYGKRLTSGCPCPFFTCSVTDGDFCALDVKLQGLKGNTYTHTSMYGELQIETPICGDIAIANTLMAISAAETYGIDGETLRRAIAKSRGERGRMERVELDTEELSVFIDYAHTPDALERLLLSARELRSESGKIILLFGCGGERDVGKRKLMGAIASRLADRVIISSDNSRSEDTGQIIKDILKGIDKEKPYRVEPDRRAAIREAVIEAGKGDIILLAGKGHEKYEINAEGQHPFDETKIVKEAFAERQRQR